LIPFTKAHACGNDFLIVTEEAAEGRDWATLTERLCERNTGIGADGIEFFAWLNESGPGPKSGRIRLHNADGSVAEISGNGTRCVAAWMAEELGAQPGDELSITTDAGVRVSTIREIRDTESNGITYMITTDMDVPELEKRTVELADGAKIDGVFVSMGNPHFVVVLPSIDRDMPLDASERTLALLEEICFHPDFPDRTNVEFVHVLGSPSQPIHQVAIRIFERGVGPTSSSGTGTSAVSAAMIGVYDAQNELEVIAPGGAQNVQWQGPGKKLYLTGPASLIARGEAW